jgi:hypothetical protein
MAHASCVAGLQTNPHAVSDRNKANQRAYFIVHCAMGKTSGAVCPRARVHAHVDTHKATVVHARTQARCARAHMCARALTHTSLHNSAARQTAVGLRRPPYSSELSTLHLPSRRWTPRRVFGGGGMAGKAGIGFVVLKIPQPVKLRWIIAGWAVEGDWGYDLARCRIHTAACQQI